MKNKLPKYVSQVKATGKYQVIVRSKKYGTKRYVGQYNTINEAINERDKFVVENYHDFTEGYLPRGITKFRGKFDASFTFRGKDLFIGSFSSLEEAVTSRNNYIDSLK